MGRKLEMDVQTRPDGSIPDLGRQGFTAGWETLDYDDARWDQMEVPGIWEATGLHIDGAVWFRRTIEIPAAWAGRDLRLNLGAVDDFDVTFFNGQQVGSTGTETPGWWIAPRSYVVPGELVKAGRNVIALRVFDQFMRGGLTGPAGAMFVIPVDTGNRETPAALTGTWKYQVEAAKIDLAAANASSMLFNAMLHPLMKAAIKGAIWYQGESNADRSVEYRQLFPNMIADWRQRWGQGDFPFYFVQLAGYGGVPQTPGGHNWAEMRESQSLALAVPNTGMAAIIDIGMVDFIHPLNKQEVGRRLGLVARAKTYRAKIEDSGPVYKSMKIDGGKIVLLFDHLAGGLVSRNAADPNKLRFFAIAGKDRVWKWADARIDGSTVVLTCDAVQEPVAARYAWAANIECDFFNRAGLPAVPFRTDDWALTTADKLYDPGEAFREARK